MKRDRLLPKIIEDLERGLTITLACRKHSIANRTFYRWRKDMGTSLLIQEALDIGEQTINNMAEQQLFSKIKEGDMRAIIYRLDRREPLYAKKVSKDYDFPETKSREFQLLTKEIGKKLLKKNIFEMLDRPELLEIIANALSKGAKVDKEQIKEELNKITNGHTEHKLGDVVSNNEAETKLDIEEVEENENSKEYNEFLESIKDDTGEPLTKERIDEL